MKYIDRLQASEEDLNQAAAESRASEAESELQAKIASKNASVTRLNNQADKILNRYPLDVNAYIDAKNKAQQAEQELEGLKAAHEELF